MGNVKVEHEGLCKNLCMLSGELPVSGVGGTCVEKFFLYRRTVENVPGGRLLSVPMGLGADVLSGGSGICICDRSSLLLPGRMLWLSLAQMGRGRSACTRSAGPASEAAWALSVTVMCSQASC